MSSSVKPLEFQQTKCPACGDDAHEPGQSKRSNCGESELVQPAYGHYSGGAYFQNQTEPLPYIRSRFYTRKGQPRLEFRK